MTVRISAINSWEEHKYLLFFDLDETLYDHNDEQHRWFHQLESYIRNLKDRYQIRYGIVTGCNLTETERKLESLEIRQLPISSRWGLGRIFIIIVLIIIFFRINIGMISI